jgi:hypothetical protein
MSQQGIVKIKTATITLEVWEKQWRASWSAPPDLVARAKEMGEIGGYGENPLIYGTATSKPFVEARAATPEEAVSELYRRIGMATVRYTQQIERDP